MSLLSSFAGGMLNARQATPTGLLTEYGFGPEQMFFIPIPETDIPEEETPEEIVQDALSSDVGVFDESDNEVVVTPAVGGMGNMGRLGGALGGAAGLLLGGVPLGLLGGLAGTAYDVNQAEKGFMNPYSTPDAGIGSAFLNNMSFGLLGRSADQQLMDQYTTDRRNNALQEFYLASAGLGPSGGRSATIVTPGGTRTFINTDIFPDEQSQSDSDRGYGGDRGKPGGGPSGRSTTERGGLGGL